MILTWLHALLLVFELLLAVPVGYLLFLTVLALAAPRRTPLPAAAPAVRFAVLVPAHNEERLLPDLLASIGACNYPQGLISVHVVADNCNDATAAIARRAGAAVHERSNTTLVGKGHALNWLLGQLAFAAGQEPDAFVIFDADTVVHPGFFTVMAARMAGGAQAVQGYYTVRRPETTGAALRYAALAVLHYLRPLGRARLGGGAGLKGNGMCFDAGLYRSHPWSGSVTEDIEYAMTLLLDGVVVQFAPDAVVEAEMPASLGDARTQNVRWESGRMEMARRYVPRLLGMTLRRGSFAALDAALEHIIPPTALLVLGLLSAVMAGGLLWGLGAPAAGLALGVGLLAGQALYLAAGLLLAGAPGRVWLALLTAPFYMVWKVILLARILLGRERQGWVRTRRNE